MDPLDFGEYDEIRDGAGNLIGLVYQGDYVPPPPPTPSARELRWREEDAWLAHQRTVAAVEPWPDGRPVPPTVRVGPSQYRTAPPARRPPWADPVLWLSAVAAGLVTTVVCNLLAWAAGLVS